MTPKAFLPLLALTAIVSGSVGYAVVESKLSHEQHGPRDHWVFQGEGSDRGSDEGRTGKAGSGVHGVPGPVAGAGLPIIAIGGLGVYWLVRRHRRKTG